MSEWRRRAVESFSDLRLELHEHNFTLYQLFFELLPRVRQAHRAGDVAQLAAIYGFAGWCFSHPDLQNAAAVAFYEHLFDERWMWRSAATWIPQDVRAACRSLWSARLAPSDAGDLERLLSEVEPQWTAAL
jgi:hypothetical protein